MRLRDGRGYTVTDGHDLARAIIEKHGVDRYPNMHLALLKLMEEVGELTREYLKGMDRKKFAKEYADVGLTLYAIGNQIYLNLEEEMLKVVSEETRKFA